MLGPTSESWSDGRIAIIKWTGGPTVGPDIA
jgi:hypothetical protein